MLRLDLTTKTHPLLELMFVHDVQMMYRWRKNHHSWMEDSWLQLDGEAVEREVTNAFKTMAKVSKTLAGRDLPACAENCLAIKEEVAVFKAFVPLVQALRNPGMRERHWDLLSERLRIDLHPQDSFTLTDAQVCPQHSMDLAHSRICPVVRARGTIHHVVMLLCRPWAYSKTAI